MRLSERKGNSLTLPSVSKVNVVKLTEGGSAKFFVKSNGDAVLQNRGILNDREIAKISEFIKDHYQEMYLRWSQYSDKGYYEK